MKKLPGYLVIFFLAITVGRNYKFLHEGMNISPFVSACFAIGVALCVYVGSYFVGFGLRWTFPPALIVAVLANVGDLWMNEMEMVRTWQIGNAIAWQNFAGISATNIQLFIEWGVVGIGALPTLFASGLGWLQGRANKIADEEFGKPGILTRFGNALGSMFDAWGVRAAFAVEAFAKTSRGNARQAPSEILPGNDKENKKAARHKGAGTFWDSLSSTDIAYLAEHGRTACEEHFGVSNGTIAECKRKIKNGDRPWIKNARQLPELVEVDRQ